jgi:hypothetical protein
LSSAIPRPVQPAVAFLEAKRWRVPALERLRRLHVEVSVDENRRCLRRLVVGCDCAEEQLTVSDRSDVRLAACASDEALEPVGSAQYILAMTVVCADARDSDELG